MMAEAAHTPGPWSEGGFRIRVKTGRGTDMIAVADILPAMTSAERQANVNLIVAAPEMLLALRTAERQLVAVHGEPIGANLESKAGADAIREVRAAIAKAEGRA